MFMGVKVTDFVTGNSGALLSEVVDVELTEVVAGDVVDVALLPIRALLLGLITVGCGPPR